MSSPKKRARQQDPSQQRDYFWASVAHDLKTPLTAIKLRTQLIRRDALPCISNPELLLNHLRDIEVTVRRMADSIDELLDVALLEGGHPVELRRGACDLAGVAREMVEEHRKATDAHRFWLEVPSEGLVGWWDVARIRRVVDNLIANAVKYSFEGGEIRVRVYREDAKEAVWAVLSVQDFGLGIPQKDLPLIFQRFHRATNATKIPGTGVGLAVAYEVVRHHGGSIRVRSQEGKGSNFLVRLPLEVITLREL